MSTNKRTIVLAAFLAVLGYGFYQAYQASQLHNRVRTLEQAQEELTTRVDQLRREKQDAVVRSALVNDERGGTNNPLAELLRLRGEVARLQSDSDELARLKTVQGKEQKAQREPPAGPWIKRLNQLQQYLAQNSSETIPEMQFAEASAWLNSVQSELETEDALRNASFMFRNQAQMKFTGFIGEAVRQFEKANNGQFPTDLSQLLQYCDPAVGSTMLDLYEIVPRTAVQDPKGSLTGDWLITRKVPVNPGSREQLAVVGDGKRAWYGN
jgi:hypothetical protein